jgi:hypothetical protein
MRQYGNLHFLRVYDAGHMVPMNQPENSLEMLRRFVADDWTLTSESEPLEDEECEYEFAQACFMQELCGVNCDAGCLFSYKKGGFLGDETTDCRCGDCKTNIKPSVVAEAKIAEPEPVEDDTCPYEFAQACFMQELCGVNCDAGCLFSYEKGGFLGDDTTDCRCGDCKTNLHSTFMH